ncbi:hypothetical protein [Mucilaginibacter sp.]
MEMATKSQITKLHVLFNNLDLIGDKTAIIEDLTNGRTNSSKGLYLKEAKQLIARLCEFDPSERLRTIIIQAAWQAGIIYGNSDTDKLLNRAKLDLFLKEKGAVKIELYKQNYPQLRKTNKQMQAICKAVGHSRDKKAADSAVSDLLKELQLTSIK